MHKVLIPLAHDCMEAGGRAKQEARAEGCEELEAVTIIDLLRRAEITVVSAGLDTNPVTASRGTVLIPDTDLDTALQDDYDMVVLPGGRSRTSMCFATPVRPCTMAYPEPTTSTTMIE